MDSRDSFWSSVTKTCSLLFLDAEPGPSSSSQPVPRASEWRPVFSVQAEGSAPGQLQKPTDVAFLGRDTVAVADYGNSRYLSNTHVFLGFFFFQSASIDSRNHDDLLLLDP